MKNYWYFSIFIFAVIWACSSDGDDPATDDSQGTDDTTDDVVTVTFSRAELLENWADNIIIPSYQAFMVDFEAMEAAFDTFQADRTVQNFDTLRAAWMDAYMEWQHISLFENGPAETDGLRLNINTFPTDVALLESQVASGTYNFDLASVRDTKGFPALDYLFNGLDIDGDGPLATFTDSTTGDAYVTYTADVISDIGTRVAAVLAAWTGGFRDTFVASDGSSATSSVDRMTNDFIFYFERFLRAGKMGIPAGIFANGVVAPNTIEAFYSEGLSNQLFLEGLDAVQDFFNGVRVEDGVDGIGFDDYLQSIAASNGLDTTINSQFNSARTAVMALGSFLSEIENNDPPLEFIAAYDEVQRNVAFIKTDMFSFLSIDVDFVDADGD